MARAGFYAIESRRIRFGRDGRWYSDDEPIENEKIAALFSRSIRRGPDGRWMLQMGEEKSVIEVDDTPYVIVAVDGDPERGFEVQLNDGTREALDPTTLRIGEDHAFYCAVKDGSEGARFLRPAYYGLSRWILAGDRGFALPVQGRNHPVLPRRG